MHTWSRGDKIAFWSLVVGAISAYAAIKTIPGPSPEPSAPPAVQVPGAGPAADPAVQQMLSQQEQFREEQARAARDETVRIFEARMALRRERMNARQAELSASGAGFSTVAFRNECDRAIDVAANYLELDDTWISRGWWSVPPGQELDTNIVTTNQYIYLFAENQQHALEWSVTADRPGITRPVVSARFDLPDGEASVYPNTRSGGYFMVDMGPGFRRYVHSFSCYPTTPEPSYVPADSIKLMG